MSGPEHYRKAEDLLREAEGVGPERAATLVSYAQVHALLAQVAATIEPTAAAYYGPERGSADWVTATS